MKFRNFGISILFAIIPGVVLPLVFWNLFSSNTSATGRDILPALDNPLELTGCIGSLIFASSVFIIFGTLAAIFRSLHSYGLIIPIYDMLSSGMQSKFLLVIAFAINVLLWSLPLMLFFRIKNHVVLPSNAIRNETKN